MPNVTIYAVAENSAELTRDEWGSVLGALQAHPIIASINANAVQVANEVSLTVGGASSRFALISFILPAELRPSLQGYAMQALGVGAIDAPMSQYSAVFSTIAQSVLPTVTVTLIGYDESHEVAIAEALAYLDAHPQIFPILDNPRGS